NEGRLGFGRRFYGKAHDPITHCPRVHGSRVETDDVARRPKRLKAWVDARVDVVTEAVILLQGKRVRVEDADIALAVGVVLHGGADARVARGNERGHEVGDRTRVIPKKVGRVRTSSDAAAEGEVVLGVVAEGPRKFVVGVEDILSVFKR